MNLAVIGTGSVGSALAREFRRAGYEVILESGTLQRARHLEHLVILWIHRAIAAGDRRWGLALTTEG